MKAKPKLLLLTNSLNSDPEEDIFLFRHLKKHFVVEFCHLLDTLRYERKDAVFLIRNVWPTHVYQREFERIAKRWKQKKITTYNSLDGKGDLLGKKYLIELYKQGYPVIPTYTIARAKSHLKAKRYIIKQVFGADGSGAKIVTSLKGVKQSRSHIVQPLVTFTEEFAFYFLDNTFQYALRFKNKLSNHTIKVYQPTKKEIALAQRFVNWNTMSYGIQRVDMLSLKNNTLLVNEIEDFCPYLYLEDLPKKVQTNFISNLIESIKKHA